MELKINIIKNNGYLLMIVSTPANFKAEPANGGTPLKEIKNPPLNNQKKIPFLFKEPGILYTL